MQQTTKPREFKLDVRDDLEAPGFIVTVHYPYDEKVKHGETIKVREITAHDEAKDEALREAKKMADTVKLCSLEDWYKFVKLIKGSDKDCNGWDILGSQERTV